MIDELQQTKMLTGDRFDVLKCWRIGVWMARNTERQDVGIVRRVDRLDAIRSGGSKNVMLSQEEVLKM